MGEQAAQPWQVWVPGRPCLAAGHSLALQSHARPPPPQENRSWGLNRSLRAWPGCHSVAGDEATVAVQPQLTTAQLPGPRSSQAMSPGTVPRSVRLHTSPCSDSQRVTSCYWANRTKLPKSHRAIYTVPLPAREDWRCSQAGESGHPLGHIMSFNTPAPNPTWSTAVNKTSPLERLENGSRGPTTISATSES